VDEEGSTAQGFVGAVRRFGSWAGDGPIPSSLPLSGARALTRILLRQPTFRNDRRNDRQLGIFNTEGDRDPGFLALQDESLGLIIAGALALGMSGRSVEELSEQLILTATDPDPWAVELRGDLLRDRLFEPPTPVLPEWAVALTELIESKCFVAVQEAVHAVGRFGVARDTADATGISGLSSRNVCPGTTLTIFGSFPATQPGDTEVYLPARGGCQKVSVGTWSNNAITVTVPQSIGPGCVGFVRTGSGGGFDGLSEVSGTLTQCFGAVGQIWGAAFDKVKGPITSCPPCLLGGQNKIDAAGPPVVDWFRCTPDLVEPGDRPTLSWSVRNATSISIDVMAAGGPVLAIPSPAFADTYRWPPVQGTSGAATTFRLRATNSCGTSVATAGFTLTRKPRLSITRIEVVQGEQKPDNSIRLVANRRTAVRVFVDSGIKDGFNLGGGPGGVGGLEISLHAVDVATGATRSCGPPWNPAFVAKPTADRDVLDDSVNFDVPLTACSGDVRFHATVILPAPKSSDPLQPTLPPIGFATGSTTVTFIQRQRQTILPFLVTDPMSTVSVPTQASFDAVLDGSIRMDPFPDNGFIVNPAIPLSLSTQDSLFSTLGWERLLGKLVTMFFLFPSQPVGGIRAAVVPTDVPPAGRGGMAWPRVGLTVPSLIIRSGQPVTFTHELGHTFGMQHVNCGSAPWPYDGGLPFTLVNPALDVFTRQLWPAGTNESMTYCFNQWPSEQHWDKKFDSIPIS